MLLLAEKLTMNVLARPFDRFDNHASVTVLENVSIYHMVLPFPRHHLVLLVLTAIPKDFLDECWCWLQKPTMTDFECYGGHHAELIHMNEH